MSAAILQMLPKRKGRQGPQDGRDVLRLYPRRARDYRRVYIYAIAFAGSVVKVGQTKSPRARLLTHWKTGGGEVTWIHLFGSMHQQTARRVEGAAPRALAGIAKQINGSEWFFADATKAEVLAVIRPLVAQARADVERDWARQGEANRHREAVFRLLKEHSLLPALERA